MAVLYDITITVSGVPQRAILPILYAPVLPDVARNVDTASYNDFINYLKQYTKDIEYISHIYWGSDGNSAALYSNSIYPFLQYLEDIPHYNDATLTFNGDKNSNVLTFNRSSSPGGGYNYAIISGIDYFPVSMFSACLLQNNVTGFILADSEIINRDTNFRVVSLYMYGPTYRNYYSIFNKSNYKGVSLGIFLENITPISKDPLSPGGISGPNDTPPGTFDKTSDPIPDSPLPTLSMADTGFTRIYNPTLTQVQALAEYMWKTENIFETLWNKVKQSFENPMDVMIAFNIVPVAVPDGGTADFSIMYIPTGVQLTKAANQFVDVDCGTLNLQGYYGSALDYSPNTRIQCFLPFIGMIELNPDEVMNTTLQIKYRVDIVSGGCVAKIFIDDNCLYQYSGHCSISVPFSASDFSSYMNAMLQVSALAVGAIAAGTGAALAEGSVMGAHAVGQATNKTVKHVTQTTTERNPATGRQITTGTVTTHTETERANETTEASFNGLSPQNITNTASAVMASKAGISHAGSFNGNTGYLGVRYPFLIITTPRQCLPASFQTMNGYPSMITLSLGDCTGYTRVQQVQLTGMTATNPEQAEILQLLKEGVIL